MGKDGKRICKIDTHVCITESACFTLDTNTTLLKTILPILPNTKWKWKATTKLRQHYHLAPARLSSLFSHRFILLSGPRPLWAASNSQTWHTYSWPRAKVRVLPSSAIFIWLTLTPPPSRHDVASLGYFFTPAKVTSSRSPQHVEPPLLPI